MDTIFMNSENCKTFARHVLILKLTDKFEEVKKVLLYQILVFTIHGKTETKKISYNNNKFKMSALTKDEFELPDGSCSLSDIQDYCENIKKKKSENIDI